MKALARGQRAQEGAGQGHSQQRGQECEDRAVPGLGGGKAAGKQELHLAGDAGLGGRGPGEKGGEGLEWEQG